jgi:hypothetical protein
VIKDAFSNRIVGYALELLPASSYATDDVRLIAGYPVGPSSGSRS